MTQNHFHIQSATLSNIPMMQQIYANARAFMSVSGNPTQWPDWYPSDAMLEEDIAGGKSYLVMDEQDEIQAVFYYGFEHDDTYDVIEGAWCNEHPYGVVHRIAASTRSKGAATFAIKWAFDQCHNLRIDTHVDNTPMRNLLKKLGFVECGMIWVLDGTAERIAYHKCS